MLRPRLFNFLFSCKVASVETLLLLLREASFVALTRISSKGSSVIWSKLRKSFGLVTKLYGSALNVPDSEPEALSVFPYEKFGRKMMFVIESGFHSKRKLALKFMFLFLLTELELEYEFPFCRKRSEELVLIISAPL